MILYSKITSRRKHMPIMKVRFANTIWIGTIFVVHLFLLMDLQMSDGHGVHGPWSRRRFHLLVGLHPLLAGAGADQARLDVRLGGDQGRVQRAARPASAAHDGGRGRVCCTRARRRSFTATSPSSPPTTKSRPVQCHRPAFWLYVCLLSVNAVCCD